MKSKSMVAYYGNVAIVRAICPICKNWSFVENHKTLCCGSAVDSPTRYQQICPPTDQRKRPSLMEQAQILENQGSRCFYCFRPFGSLYISKDRGIRILLIHWDHLIPFAWRQDNQISNFVASCNKCNLWKGAVLFENIVEARSYLRKRWAKHEQQIFQKQPALKAAFFAMTTTEKGSEEI